MTDIPEINRVAHIGKGTDEINYVDLTDEQITEKNNTKTEWSNNAFNRALDKLRNNDAFIKWNIKNGNALYVD